MKKASSEKGKKQKHLRSQEDKDQGLPRSSAIRMCLEGRGFNGLAGDRGLTPLSLKSGNRGLNSVDRDLFSKQDCYDGEGRSEAAAGAALGVRFWFL